MQTPGKTVLFIFMVIYLAPNSQANQIANSEVAIMEFEFDQAKALTMANKYLMGYARSDYYQKKDYDYQHPVLGSFVGMDCNRKAIRLVFVTYKSGSSDGMLWSVFRLLDSGELALEGEGPGAAKNVPELIIMFQKPFSSGVCEHD